MKHTLILLLLISGFFVSNAQEPKKVNSKITEVTIYNMGALVTESGSISLVKGNNTIIFSNISRTLDNRILILQLKSVARVISISSGIQDIQLWKQDPLYKAVLDSIELIGKQKQANTFLVSGFNGEKKMLDDNRKIGGSNNGVNTLELQKALDFYRARISEINQLLLSATKAENEINSQLNILKRRKTELEQKFQEHNNYITATISSESAGNENFNLRYFVRDCGWAPFYDIRLTDISKPMHLSYYAKMYNNTGVSWNDVKLTVSTADPNRSARYAVLEKWILGQQAYTEAGYGLQNEDKQDYRAYRGNIYGNANGNPDMNQNPQTHRQTSINVSELTIDFAIAEPKTIPFDARPYLVEMKAYDITPGYQYIAIPKLDALAYLTCGIMDWEQYNFMEGPANIYYGETFIGESRIMPQLATDTLEISLGRDSKVMLKYEKKKDFTRKSILGNTVTQTFAFEITVRNTNTRDISLDLFDQVPLSPSSDITVDVNEISKADWNKEDGKLQWNVNVKAGEAAKFIVSYSVKSPKGKQVQVQRFRVMQCPSF
jgi:uncharacterized protein (TIGR02231 family)